MPDDAGRTNSDFAPQSVPRISWGINSRFYAVLTTLVFLVAVIALVRAFREHHLDPHQRVPTVYVLLVAGVMWASFFAAVRGGATLDVGKRQLLRWWGPMVPLKITRVPFDSIRAIRIGGGLRPGSPKPARQRGRWYHVSVHTEEHQ